MRHSGGDHGVADGVDDVAVVALEDRAGEPLVGGLLLRGRASSATAGIGRRRVEVEEIRVAVVVGVVVVAIAAVTVVVVSSAAAVGAFEVGSEEGVVEPIRRRLERLVRLRRLPRRRQHLQRLVALLLLRLLIREVVQRIQLLRHVVMVRHIRSLAIQTVYNKYIYVYLHRAQRVSSLCCYDVIIYIYIIRTDSVVLCFSTMSMKLSEPTSHGEKIEGKVRERIKGSLVFGDCVEIEI